MRQAVLEQPGRLVLGDRPPPAPPRPGEALVRVRRVGVCGTDFHACKGDQPFLAYPRPLGVRVSATDVNQARLQFCRDQMGVEHTFPADASAEHALGAATRGEMPTVVFEATGNPASMERSFGFVASGGTLVLVGLCQAKIAFADPEFHRREMTLLSSRNATAVDFDRVLAAVEAGTLDTRPWVTHRPPLPAVGEAPPTMDPSASGV